MYWWIGTAVCICVALLIQYVCSSKILHMKQAVSMKSMALRDARFEGEKLEEQETELKSQQSLLGNSIRRLRNDIRTLIPRMKEKDLPVPQPSFPAGELEEGA